MQGAESTEASKTQALSLSICWLGEKIAIVREKFELGAWTRVTWHLREDRLRLQPKAGSDTVREKGVLLYRM